MYVLVFDTETTGLIENYRESLYNTSKYPYVVQLSWLLFDVETNKVVKVCDYILKVPDGITISKESSDIHGITNETSKTKGKDPKEIIALFNQDLKTADVCVCHNTRFDKRMMRIELIRHNFADAIYKGNHQWYCTMENSTDVCKLKRYDKYIHAREMLERCRDTFQLARSNVCVTYLNELDTLISNMKSVEKVSYKRPKLVELHQYLFKTIPNNLHNSLIDVFVCFRCYYYLVNNKDILNSDFEFKKRFNEICDL